MKHTLISIIMLNYNGLKYLRETIKPILSLNYPNYEFIVVDNGSTDGSLEYIRSFPNITLLQSPRLREKNFACNYAVQAAKGDYILMMDNDALITNSTVLDDLVQRYTEQTGVIGLAFYDKGSQVSKSYGSYLGYYFIKENYNIPISQIQKYDNIQIGFPEGKSLFISKKKWLEVGGYDDYLKFGGDDNDLGIKLWLMGYENILYANTLQVHLGLPERSDNTKYKLKWTEMFYAHLYTIVKNYSFFNMLITIVIYTIFGFLKSIKQGVQRRHLGTFLAFFKGYYLFITNLHIALQKRKSMQSKRIVKYDIFLKIKPPKLI